MDGEFDHVACMGFVLVVVEALLRSMPRKRSLRFIAAATELFDERVTPIGADLVGVSARKLAGEAWRRTLPDALKRLG